MKAEFTFDEMVYNFVCAGRGIYHNEQLKVIEYIKMDKNTRQLLIHCVDGDVFAAMQDELHTFEVTKKLVWKKPNLKRLRGK